MSVLITWLWTNNEHRPLRAPARPGVMVANPQRRTRLPKDPNDHFPIWHPFLQTINCYAFHTRVGSSLGFGITIVFHLNKVCLGQCSSIATQLFLVYTAIRPRTALCVRLQKGLWARNKLYAVWNQVEWLDLSLWFDLSSNSWTLNIHCLLYWNKFLFCSPFSGLWYDPELTFP